MAATSTSDAVGAAAAAIVTALGLVTTGPPPAPIPVVRRKTPSVPEGASQGLPQIVISVGAERRTEYLTAAQKLKTYPVAATIVDRNGQQLADDATVRRWREQVELAIESRSHWTSGPAALVGWNRASITNEPPFDTAALSKDYSYSTVTVEIEVIEARG